MKKLLASNIFIFCIAIGLFNCKKGTEPIEKNENKNAAIIKSIEEWYRRVIPVSCNDGVSRGRLPRWETAVFLINAHKVVFEFEEGVEEHIHTYLVISLDKNDDIKEGNFYLTFFNENEKVAKGIFVLEGYLLDQNNANSEDCSILKFSMESTILSIDSYGTQNKILKQYIFSSESKGKKKAPPLLNNPTLPCEGGQWIQVDWYMSIIEDGVLVDYYYLFSTWSCTGYVPGGGGSGGGGGTGGGSGTETCDICIQGGSISSEELRNITYVTGDESEYSQGIERLPKNAKWNFLKLNFGLGYIVSYSAFFNGVVYREPRISNLWKWESIVYSQTSQSAGTIPPCFSVSTSVNIGGPIISADGSKATASLTYTASGSITCLGGMQAFTKSGSIAGQDFYAN